MSDALSRAAAVADDNPELAIQLCMQYLRDNPESAPGFTLGGVLHARAGVEAVALAFFERAVKLAPRCETWNNYGSQCHTLKLTQQARQAFERALAMTDDPRKRAVYMCNMAATYTDDEQYARALEWTTKAEKLDPACANLSQVARFPYLAIGDWRNGWRHWRSTIGTKHRKWLDFGGAEWNGEPTGTLVIYGEQGIGDEIAYASCIEDCRPLAERVIIECDPRLEALYARSFPWATVYGTRRGDRDWLAGTRVDAQVPVGNLPAYFRPEPASCPKTPYLVPDPERVLMWRALFASWGKPVVGLCWSGGRFESQQQLRRVGLEAFRDYMGRRDAVYVSLQYTDPREEIAETGLPVRFFSECLSEANYDETAAIVAALDDMVGIHTSAHHVRGAMGLPSTVLVPSPPMWQYAHGDGMPWYAGQVYHRQRKHERWIDCVNRLRV